MEHCVEDLIRIFNDCFAHSYQTRLERGEEEPLYLPKDSTRDYHVILFARGFFSSALHEVSHWLIAGDRRRMLIDYGYWYEPDGRTEQQQRLFEHVEVKPQALEWVLSNACDFQFQLSVDNLNGEPGDNNLFQEAVYQQFQDYTRGGLPQRAQLFRNALSQFYRGLEPLSKAE